MDLRIFTARLRCRLSVIQFILAVAAVNAAIYNRPLFAFAAANLIFPSTGGILTIATIILLAIIATVLGLGILALISQRLVKPFCMLCALCSAIALYFIETYGVVLDKSMISNVFNTNLSEVGGLFHPRILGYILAFGVLPIVVLSRLIILEAPFPKRIAFFLISLVILIGWMYAASTTWLWIDKNSRKLGGLTLPWSYIIGATRVLSDRWPAPHQERLLPPARFIGHEKSVVMLVIGESAREMNFSLYGYGRETNPLTARLGVVALSHTRACTTYTTASLLCMLSPGPAQWNSSSSDEPLPSYLRRHGIDVIWRTNNWGEPPIKVDTYQRAEDIPGACNGDSCRYDETLLHGLGERIRSSVRDKVFVVLHLHGSHGPSYASEYPQSYEFFRPVCRSVVLDQCTNEALVNTYDNTIRYTDSVLASSIDLLKGFSPVSTVLIYISDHGESLGESGLYLHGTPSPIAPDAQIAIPFLIWMSPEFQRHHQISADLLARRPNHSQEDVFHSIMGALEIRSDVYKADRDVFSLQSR